MAITRFRCFELHAGGPDDPDASRSGAVVAAYFDVERARACRRVVWRAVAVCGLGGWALAATVSGVAEWRARRKLATLVA